MSLTDVGTPGRCTLFPDGEWGSCCATHDRQYREQTITRAEADRQLRACVSRAGHPRVAWVMWIGARLVGWFFWTWRAWRNAGAANREG